MNHPRILVAGIGNIFLGDDGFGVEVVRRLAERPQAEGVRVADFGIRGLDLAYALMDGFDLAILVDAAPRGQPPGTIYLIEPDWEEHEASQGMLQTHGMDPISVLRLVQALGGQPCGLRLVGCEPETLGTEEDPVMGLSEPVEAAVAEAIRLIESVICEESAVCNSELGQRLHTTT